MSSRRRSPPELAALGLALGLTTALAVSSCAEDELPLTASPVDAAADVRPRDARPAPPTTDGAAGRATCLDDCAAAHPGGRARDEAIEACWQASCRECVEANPGTDAGADAGADAGSACVTPVTTGRPGCDACTRASCCASWDACFADPACAAYNACATACPAR